jgi:hypothetical protein
MLKRIFWEAVPVVILAAVCGVIVACCAWVVKTIALGF